MLEFGVFQKCIKMWKKKYEWNVILNCISKKYHIYWKILYDAMWNKWK